MTIIAHSLSIQELWRNFTGISNFWSSVNSTSSIKLIIKQIKINSGSKVLSFLQFLKNFFIKRYKGMKKKAAGILGIVGISCVALGLGLLGFVGKGCAVLARAYGFEWI